HSLLATRLAAQVKQKVGKDLPLRVILDGSSVGQMAAVLEQQSPTTESMPLMPVDRAVEAIPISFQQEELWFMNRPEHLGLSYDNVQFAYRIFGELDHQAYIKCFKAMVARHEIVRTSYVERDGVILQQVNSADDFKVYVEKLPDESALDDFLRAEQ